jgi:hypothetical protein
MSGLLGVLIVVGWSTREPDQQDRFERCLPPIFKAVQDLRKTLGEDIISMDMEVAIIEPGEAFNPTYMEDGYGDTRASSGTGKKTPEKVGGTTGLGLCKISMKRMSKGPVPHSEMVLFPKVVLEGMVKEAIDPAPPPAPRLRKKAASGVVRSDQTHMQQQQLLDVAQALVPKPPGSHPTTTELGIGVGGSSDEPQSSKEKSLRRKILELEYALQQANSSARTLWSRVNAQSEELQKSQRQVHRLLDDDRSLTHELEAVKVQLADATKLSEVLMVLAAGKTLSEVRVKELKVDTTDVDQKTNNETWDMPGGSDILLTAVTIQIVDVLNEEVRRVVAVLGKVLQKAKFEEGRRQIVQITEKARLMLGENMVALLSSGVPEKARLDPLLVQVVLQVAITNWCKAIISSWKPGNSDVSNLLDELYSKVREVGKSASMFKSNPRLRQKYLFRRSNILPSMAISNLGTTGIFI